MIRHQPIKEGGWVAIHEDITERFQAQQRIEHMARHDTLTGLSNRACFHESVERAIEALPDGQTFALLCVDLDRFKEANDALGHGVGDAILREVAVRLRQCAGPRDTPARIGGDEFAVVHVGPIDEASLGAFARRILDAIDRPMEIDGTRVDVGASIGVSRAPLDDVEGPLAAPHGGCGALPRQGGGPRRLPDLPRRDGRQAARAPSPGRRLARRHRRQRLRSPLPADRRRQHLGDPHLRSARPLAASGARHDRLWRLHPARRADRADRRARRLDPARRLPGGDALAGRGAGLGQCLRPAVRRRSARGDGRGRSSRDRPCARPARARNHRIRHAGRRRRQAGDP